MEQTLSLLNPWWSKTFQEKTILRNKYLKLIKENLDNKLVLFLTGLRRVGKTTLIKQTINYLIKEKKVLPKKILFLNLDHIDFIPYTIHEIIDKYREMNEIKYDEFIYIFLDEITSKENFAQEVKNLFDVGNTKIFCSSSIATLMKDKKAYLTGRTKTIEVFPLDFEEFLIFKKADVSKFDKNLNKKWFEKYLDEGGMPEFVLNQDVEQLTELLNSIIYKDVMAHYNIKNEKEIKELLRLLCQRIGKPTSYNKLGKILNLSGDTIKKYLTYFENTYLFYSVEKYSKSINENITSPKKFYIADLGLKKIISSNKERGVDFENLVFLKIKEKNPSYYLENGVEIDFCYKDTLIEAKYGQELNEKQKELFKKAKFKNKFVIDNYEFFLS